MHISLSVKLQRIYLMYNDRMKEQGHNGGQGKYTATGFIPSRERVTVNNDGDGCLSFLGSFGIIVLIVSISVYFIM